MTNCLSCKEEIDDGTCAFQVRYGTYLEIGFVDEGLAGYVHPGCGRATP